MIPRLAVVAGLGGLLVAIATIVWACIPEPPPPDQQIVVPAAPVKSLVEWWESDRCFQHSSRYYWLNQEMPPHPTRAYYVGSIAPQNLVARCNVPKVVGGFVWGPAARDEGYVVKWRGDDGSGLEIHVEPHGWSPDRIKADLEACEGKSVSVVAATAYAPPYGSASAPRE